MIRSLILLFEIIKLLFMSLNNRLMKQAILVFGGFFLVYGIGSWFGRGSVDIEYYDQRRFFTSNLVNRVEKLEDQMKNFSETLVGVRSKLLNMPSPTPTHVTTSFWLNDISHWNDSEFDKAYTNPNASKHTTTLVTTNRCQSKLKLLILISTNVNRTYARETIRRTWGNDPSLFKPRWKTIFLVGRSHNRTAMAHMLAESERFGDIVKGNFYENFFNLSFKVQAGFEWAHLYCGFDYLLKGDDDVFVNIPRLFAFLRDPELPKTELYTGNVHYQAVVFRKGRYFVTKDEYKKKYYPRYCSGGGFILSRDVVANMIPHFNLVNPLKIDDAYVGELALKAGVDVVHDNSFQMFQNEKGKGLECKYYKWVIVQHPVPSRDCMESLYRSALLIED